MKEHLDILITLVAFVCLVNATTDQPLKPQLPKNSTGLSAQTGRGSGLGGGAVGGESPRGSFGGGSSGGPDGGPVEGFPGTVSAAAVGGSGGVPATGNGGGGIIVLSSGSRPPGSNARPATGSARIEKPEQVPRNTRDDGPSRGIGGSIGQGAGGGVRRPGVNTRGLGGGLGDSPAGGAQPSLGAGSGVGVRPATVGGTSNDASAGNANSDTAGFGVVASGAGSRNPSSGSPSRTVGGGPGRSDGRAGRAGSPGGQRGDLPPGDAEFGSGFSEDSSSSGTFGVVDSFPDGLGESSSFGNAVIASGVSGARTSATAGSSFGSPTSGGVGVTGGSGTSVASNGNPRSRLSQGVSLSGSTPPGNGRGTTLSSPRNSPGSFGRPGTPTSASVASGYRGAASGPLNGSVRGVAGGASGLREDTRTGGEGFTGASSARRGSNSIPQHEFSGSGSSGNSGIDDSILGGPGTGNSAGNLAGVTSGPRGGASASSDDDFRRHASGLGPRLAGVGGRGGGNIVGAEGVSEAPVPAGRRRLTGSLSANRGFNRTPQSNLRTSGPSRGRSGTRAGDSASIGAGPSGTDVNADVVVAPQGTGSNSDDSNFDSSGAGARNGRVGGGAGGASGHREDTRSGGGGFAGGSRANGGSNGSPENDFFGSGLSGSSGIGDSFAGSLGTEISAGNSAVVAGGRRGGASASFGGDFGSPGLGLGSHMAEVGGRDGGYTAGAGRVSRARVQGGGLRLNGGTGRSGRSNRTPQSNVPTGRPSRGHSGTGDSDSASVGSSSSGSNLDGGVATAQRGTGSSNSGYSNFGSSGTGSGSSAGTGGELSASGSGNGGGAGVLEPSSATSGSGDLPESGTGDGGSTATTTRQNSTDSDSTDTDDNSNLSIPLGGGPLGFDVPKWVTRFRGERRHDPAVTAAVALGALAGVAAVGALGAGIAAAVQASRRRQRPIGSARRGAVGRRRRKPAIMTRGDRQRRSIPESKVPAEILDQIPMNFERLY